MKKLILISLLLAASAAGQSGFIAPKIRNAIDLPPSVVTEGKLWARWKASRMTAVADGADVGTWTDISGNGRHISGVSGGAIKRDPAAGLIGNTVALDFTGGFYVVNGMNALTEAEIYFLVKADADPAVSPCNTGLHSLSNGSNYHCYPETNGDISYEHFGSTTQVSIANPAGSLADWRIYNVVSQPGTNGWKAYLDGSLLTQRTVTVQFRPVGNLGADWFPYNFKGRMAEVIILSTAATAEERAGINTYLQREYLGM